MGKGVLIYFPDELLNLFEAEPNKSGLVTDLLRQHYNDSEGQLNIKLEKLQKQTALIKDRLLDKKKVRVKDLREKEQEIKDEQGEIEKLNLLETWNGLRNAEEITDAEYWDAYDEEKKAFNMDKVKSILTKLEETKK